MKKFTKLFALVLAMVMTVSLITGVDAQAAKKKTYAKSIAITNATSGKKIKKNATVTLAKGAAMKIQGTVTMTDKKKNTKVTYKSSNSKIAAVKKGVITAKKAGKATITVTSKDKTKKKKTVAIKFKVNVLKKGTYSIAVEGDKTVTEGATGKLTAKVSVPKKADKTVGWSSADKNIATVDANGVVTGVKAGKVNITATLAGNTKKKATYEVEVVPAKKTYTEVALVDKATATVEVTFTKDADKDVQALVAALGLKSGQTKAVKVNGEDKVVTVKDNTLYVGAKKLADVAKNNKATISIGTDAKKALQALKAVNFSQASDAKVKIGTVEFSEYKTSADKVTTVKVGTKVVTVESISNGVITVVGDETAAFKGLVDAKIATAKTVEK